MAMKRLFLLIALAIPTAFATSACDSGSTVAADEDSRLSVYLKDAPGDVAAVWVDIEQIYFQGGPGGRLTVSEAPTGLIELLALRDHAQQIVDGLAIEPGLYSQLRFVLASAVLETTDGRVFAFGGAEHPGGLPVTGELKCPSCSNSGIKVKLAGDAVELEEGANGLMLDFDVGQSLGRELGNSGKWRMSPVIHATRIKTDDPDDPDAGSTIAGSVALAQLEQGGTVVIPACPDGEARTVQDFVPLATAATLLDGEGLPIVRSGNVDEEGRFEIEFVEPDAYQMGFQAEVAFSDFKLVFGASAEPAEVVIAAGESADGVAYTVLSATCEANTGG